MTVNIARFVMAVAVCSLRGCRSQWAAAMRVEFEQAVEDGAPLSFAAGCLAAAWRELPFHGQGRLRLTSVAVALGLVVPIAVLNLLCSLPGFSFMAHGHDRYYTMLATGSLQQRELAGAYKDGVPVITGGIVVLALLHFRMAWAMLSQRFGQLAVLWPLTGLIAGMLLVLAIRLFPHGMSVAPTVFAGLAVELVSVPALAWWQGRLSRAVRRSRL